MQVRFYCFDCYFILTLKNSFLILITSIDFSYSNVEKGARDIFLGKTQHLLMIPTYLDRDRTQFLPVSGSLWNFLP